MAHSAADALEEIRQGGTKLILSAQTKLVECKRLLDRGEFSDAHTTALQLLDRLEHLSDAQATLGRVAGHSLVPARDLCVGMVSENGIRITEVAPCPCEVEGCEKVLLTFADGRQELVMPEIEMVVVDE